MLIEIPDPEVILGVIIAFLIGLDRIIWLLQSEAIYQIKE